MKKANKKKISSFLVDSLIYITILSFCFLFINKILDSDLFFDLRSAEDILQYGLDFKDHMSMFNGFTYLYHHWLYDLIIFPIFKLGSYQLLFLFIVLIFFAFSLLAYKIINNRTNNKIVSLITTIVLIFIVGNQFNPRVKSLNYLLMLVEYFTIYKLYETGKIKYSIISILTSILLVNIHFPLWLLVPIFYLPYLAQLIVNYLKKKFNIKLLDKKIEFVECNNTKTFIITFILILLTCLISPYGMLPYVFPFELLSEYNSVYSFIPEMKHVVIGFDHNTYKILFCFILFIIMIISKKKIKLSDLFYLLGLAIFGLQVYRNLPYFLMYSIIIIACTLFKNFKFKKIRLPNIKIKYNPIIVILIICEIIFIGLILEAMDFKNYHYGIDNGGEPIILADYITDNLDYKNLKFYNEFSQGSYLAYRGIPTFIDTRVEVFIKKFNKKEDVIRYYYNDSPEELLRRYKFDYIITYYNSDMYNYVVNNNYEEVYNEYKYYYLFKNKEA